MCYHFHSVVGIMDTKSGKVLTVSQAVRQGVIDPHDSSFVSSADGEKMTFQEALQRGYILSEKLSEDAHLNGDTTSIDTIEANSGPDDYEVDNVLDPRTKYRVSLPYAVSKGIVEPSRSEYRNPDTGEYMSLTDAVSRGVVKASKVEPGSSVKAIINLLQLHDTGATPVRYVLPHANEDSSVSSYKALSRHMDSRVKAVLNHDGEPLSIREAYQSGLIKFDSLSYVNPDGSTIPLEKAAQQGLVTMPAMQCILGACKKLSLQNQMDSRRISPDGAKLLTAASEIPLDEAIKDRKIDPYAVFLRDKTSGDILSLGCAVDEGIVTPEDGKSLEKCLEAGDIIPAITPSTELKAAFVVEKLTESNKDIKIKNPSTNEELPLREAVKTGLYDTQRAEVVDPDTDARLSLAEAVEQGLISKPDAKALFEAMDNMSLQQAMSNNMMNGEWFNPDTKSNMTLQEAIDEGHLIPETVFFVDQANGRIGTLATGIKDGKTNELW